MTAADLLDSIKRARAAVTLAEDAVKKAEAVVRDRKKALVAAREKAERAIEEALADHRQPSLFDAVPEPAAPVATAPAPEPALVEQTAPSVPPNEVFSLVGESAEVIIRAPATDLVPQGDASEWVELAPSPPLAVTKLSTVDNFPDAVADALLMKGITTVETLLEQLAAYDARLGDAGEMPLRNRLVAFLVAEIGCRMRPSEHAADAVAKYLAPKADEPRKGSDTPVKGEPIEAFGLKPNQLHRVPWDDLKKHDAMKQFNSDAPKPLRVDHITINGRPHVVLSELEHFPRPGKTWEVRPLWPADVARNRGVAPTGADPLEALTVEIKMGNGSLAGWVKYQIGAKREQRNLIHKPEPKPAKGKRKAGAK